MKCFKRIVAIDPYILSVEAGLEYSIDINQNRKDSKISKYLNSTFNASFFLNEYSVIFYDKNDYTNFLLTHHDCIRDADCTNLNNK